MQLKVYNTQNKEVGALDVDDRLFGAPWNPDLVQQVLKAQLANRRRNWAHAKDRSEVRGGGRKPWRQKGTGRARHGSIRSPIWVGGGKAHGPLSEKNYAKKVNKKMRRAAVRSVLSRKLADEQVKVVDVLQLEAPKTKLADSMLRSVVGLEKPAKKFDVLVVRNPEQKELPRAMRNLVKTKVVDPQTISVEDLLKFDTVIFEKEALNHLSYLYE